MKKIVVLDDDFAAYGPGGLGRKIIERAFKGSAQVRFCVTEEEWIEFHRDPGKPDLILHDWDVSTFSTETHQCVFSVEWSVITLLTSGFNVVLYTASEMVEAQSYFLTLAQMNSFQTKTFTWSGSTGLIEIVEANFYTLQLEKLQKLSFYTKGDISKIKTQYFPPPPAQSNFFSLEQQ